MVTAATTCPKSNGRSEPSGTGRSDEDLLLSYRAARDEASFARLVKRYERELFGFLRRYLGNVELAEDVFQRTFLQVHLKCERFDGERKFRPWLYRIATNQAIDVLRRTRRHRALSLNVATGGEGRNSAVLDNLPARGPSPAVWANRQETRAWARRVVADLPQRLKLVVHLIYYQGLSYRETAEILSVPVGTVKSRMNAALVRLRKAWRQNEETLSDGSSPSDATSAAASGGQLSDTSLSVSMGFA
jgi:RNA polymerase sigma-70 factor (ECF subfamily)